ncbi:MAG TPA: glycosyltransferase family 1 protein [Chloroflexota bacterium]|nr:glycosyltransferase family 1 protein [Chloroflexota bacterium]
MNPRVGFLTYGLDRAPTGIGRYAVELLRALARLPAQPEVVLLTTEAANPFGLGETFEHHALPGCRLLPALLTVGNAALSLAARRYRLDLLHDPNGIAPFFGPAAGARRVVTIHDAFAYVCPEEHNRLDNWRYHALLPRAARRADAVITVSNCSRDDLASHLELAPGRIAVIAEGVDPRFRPVSDGGERRAALARYGVSPTYLLYVGAINGRKNLPCLLEAYARLRAEGPAIPLVIVGKRQWHTTEIGATLARLGLEGKVHFTGYVDDADLPALYSAAAAFVFPSLYEGFGLPPLEAMACGTPVVTSRASAIPEVVGDDAVLVDPLDVDAIAVGIRRVLEHPAEAAALRERGLARARQFTWDRAARETVALYRQILEGTDGER